MSAERQAWAANDPAADLAALEALRSGTIDALVVQTPYGERVFTPDGTDDAYRTLVETMPEGAASLSDAGTVLYANGRLAELLRLPLTHLFGVAIDQFIAPADASAFLEACHEACHGTARGELELVRADGSVFPAGVALTALPPSAAAAMTIVITDLSARDRREREARLIDQIGLSISSAVALDEALGEVLEHVCHHFGWSAGEAWLPTEDGSGFACAASAGSSGPCGRGLVIPAHDGDEVVCVLVFDHDSDPSLHGQGSIAVLADASRQLGMLIRRKRTESRLRAITAELQLRSELLDMAHDAVIVFESEESRITYWNRQAQSIYGYSAAEAVGQVMHELLATVFPDSRAAVNELLERDGKWAGELRHRRKDGTMIVVASRAALHRDRSGRPVAVIELNSDVTVQRQVEERNRLLAAVVNSTRDAVIATSANGIIIQWNRGAEELYGYTAAEALCRPVSMLSAPERLEDEQEIQRRVAAGEDIEQYETVWVRKDGVRVPVSLTVSPIRDGHGEVTAVARISRDISDSKRYESELAHLADHDSLTGLYNRRRFQEELDHELARSRRDKTGGALLGIDLDHFKFINDSQGHHVGDQLIIQAAASLRQRLRVTDVIGRMGGDEFAVLLRGVDAQAAQQVAEQLLKGLGDDVDAPRGVRRVTASIGIAPFTAESQFALEDLFVEADIAMYDAKEAGRGRAAVYDPERDRHRRLGAGLGWADRIRDALDHGGFVLWAQPIASLNGDGRPRYELLLRMVDADGDLVAPDRLLPVAERMNLSTEIDRWVLRAAVQTLAAAQRDAPEVCLHLNLSADTTGDPDFPALIAQELRSAGAQGSGLCFEIDESAAIVNLARSKRFAQETAKLGCALALDHFGAGYASFSHLKQLSFDFLKIDGEFIENLAHDPTDHLVVQAFAGIAQTLGKQTIAECVADDQTLRLLQSCGIDFAQGFQVGHPEPLADAELSRAVAVGQAGQLRELREALAEERLELFAQPIIDLRTRAVVTHELLLRVRGRDGVIRSTAPFLAAAESSRAIHETDRWVIREAARLASQGHHIELNLSAESLGEPDLADAFIRTLNECGAEPGLIGIELTETALIGDDTVARAFIERVRALGCRFALDDFGTGFASLTYLKRLPVDYLKIDMEFVQDLCENEASRNVVCAVVSLARAFGQRTVAEGVETEATLLALREMGVDYAQGYLIGRPAPVHDSLLSPVGSLQDSLLSPVALDGRRVGDIAQSAEGGLVRRWPREPTVGELVESTMTAYRAALKAGDPHAAALVVDDAYRAGLSAVVIQSRVIAPAMNYLSELYERGELTIADEQLASAVSHGVLARLYPSMIGAVQRRGDTVVVAGVEGENHVLGLRMVADVFEGAGYDVRFLGPRLPHASLMAWVAEHRPTVVALGVTLPQHGATLLRECRALNAYDPSLRIVVGGQGVPEELKRDAGVFYFADTEQLAEGVRDGLSTAPTGQLPDRLALDPDMDVQAPNLPVAGAPSTANRASGADGYDGSDGSASDGSDGSGSEGSGSDGPDGSGELSASDDLAARFAQTAAAAADGARGLARRAYALEEMAYQDVLTGLWNRRAFEDRYQALCDAEPVASEPAILMIDLDHLQSINERHGYEVGDRTLIGVAGCIVGSIRPGDFAARYGGDAFVVLLQDTALELTLQIGERIRCRIEQELTDPPVTVSIGVSVATDTDRRRALLGADNALYAAKEQGRNQLVLSRAEGASANLPKN